MRLLLLHDRYHETSPGGEIHVVRRDQTALEARGHITRLLEWPPASSGASLLRKTLVQLRAGYSCAAQRLVRRTIAAFRPDVVHVHNSWPQMTPSALYACRRAGVPVVQTLHNYRLVCAGELLLRKNTPCELCVGRTVPWPAVRHRCERGSLSRSLLKAGVFAAHHALDTWNRTVDVFVVWSESMRARFVRAGIDPERLMVKAQCAPDPGPGPETRQYFLFVGRLSPEKGIGAVLDLWERIDDAELRIVGGGVLEPRVRALAARRSNVRYLGALTSEEVLQSMRHAIATLVPSRWEEPAPLVIAESYAAATPVIAADTGARAESVAHGETGLVFPAGEWAMLEQHVRWVIAHPATCRELGRAARGWYEKRHTEAGSYARLMAIYARAQARRAGRFA